MWRASSEPGLLCPLVAIRETGEKAGWRVIFVSRRDLGGDVGAKHGLSASGPGDPNRAVH